MIATAILAVAVGFMVGAWWAERRWDRHHDELHRTLRQMGAVIRWHMERDQHVTCADCGSRLLGGECTIRILDGRLDAFCVEHDPRRVHGT